MLNTNVCLDGMDLIWAIIGYSTYRPVDRQCSMLNCNGYSPEGGFSIAISTRTMRRVLRISEPLRKKIKSTHLVWGLNTEALRSPYP